MTKRPSEFDLIRTYFAPLSASEIGAFNLTDDAAVVTPTSGQSLVVTTDALVEGVHFLPDDAPEVRCLTCERHCQIAEGKFVRSRRNGG